MDVLLVNAPTRLLTRHAHLNPPLGLAYIGAVLEKEGFSVTALDLCVGGFNARLLEGILSREKPRVLGISCHTETYPGALQAAELAKKTLPGISVVMGGTHPTVMHRDAAKEEVIDIVVRGEGEKTMLELAYLLIRGQGALSDIQGITYRDGDVIRATPKRPFIPNPDEIPFPARWLFPMPLYQKPGQVLFSRGGCPFNCHFCAVNNIWEGGRRFRSPCNVIREIAEVHQDFGLDEIDFADDSFTLSKSSVMELCHKAQTLQEDFPWRWSCATRVDLVDRDLLHMMAEAGCYSITFGVEAGSQVILDSIGKKITTEQVRKAVAAALEEGIAVYCSFMFPHPEDTEATVREQIRFMKELVVMGASVGMAATTPYPGTYYYEHAVELGIRILAKSWDEFDAKHLVIETRNLKRERLEALLHELVSEVGLTEEITF